MSVQELTKPKDAGTQVLENDEKTIRGEKTSFLEQVRQESGE